MNRRALVQTSAVGLAAGALAGVPGASKVAAQDQEYAGEEVPITYGF